MWSLCARGCCQLVVATVVFVGTFLCSADGLDNRTRARVTPFSLLLHGTVDDFRVTFTSQPTAALLRSLPPRLNTARLVVIYFITTTAILAKFHTISLSSGISIILDPPFSTSLSELGVPARLVIGQLLSCIALWAIAKHCQPLYIHASIGLPIPLKLSACSVQSSVSKEEGNHNNWGQLSTTHQLTKDLLEPPHKPQMTAVLEVSAQEDQTGRQP
jgi:hypothetical protein